MNSWLRGVEDGASSCCYTTWSRAWIAIVSFYLTFIALSGHSTVYYVDTQAGNDANSGVQITGAWRSLPGTMGVSGSGWVQINSGDTVYVKGGTTNYGQWYIATNYSGTATWDSIKIVSGDRAVPTWGTGRAILDESFTNTYGVLVGDSTHVVGITFDGFEIRNIAAGGVGGSLSTSGGSCCVAIGGNGAPSYIKFRSCWLHDAQRTIDNTGHGFSVNGTYLWMENNVIGPNIGTKGMDIYDADYGVIRSNLFVRTGDHCVAINAQHWDVCDNTMYLAQSNAVHGPIYGIKVEQGYADVWNNVVYRLPGSESSVLEPCGIGVFSGGNCRIIHNTAYGFRCINCGREFGTGLALGCDLNFTTNCVVEYNLVVNNKNTYPGGIAFWMFSGASNNVIAYNDFFYTNGTQEAVASIGSAAGDQTWNVASFNNLITNGCTIKGNIQVDPVWTGVLSPPPLAPYVANSPFFGTFSDVATAANLLSTINQVSGGGGYGFDQSAGKFGTDILGRPRLSYWTMGAYELYPAVLPAPTGLRIVPGP